MYIQKLKKVCTHLHNARGIQRWWKRDSVRLIVTWAPTAFACFLLPARDGAALCFAFGGSVAAGAIALGAEGHTVGEDVGLYLRNFDTIAAFKAASGRE